MLHAFIILAQEGAKESGSGGGGILQSPYLPFLLILVMALYFFIVILPGKRRAEREAQEKLKKLEKGTEVLTIGGIYGTVISVHPEKDELGM